MNDRDELTTLYTIDDTTDLALGGWNSEVEAMYYTRGFVHQHATMFN